MISELSFYGVLFHPLFVFALIALGITWLLRQIFAKLGGYRYIWHHALFDVALYVIVLFLVDRGFVNLLLQI